MKRVFFLITYLILLCRFADPLAADEGTKIKYSKAKLSIENGEGMKLEVQSRYFLDAGGFIPLGDFKMLHRDDNQVRMDGDMNFHKLRTTLQGKFDEHWGFKFEIDYGKARLKYQCMQLDYYLNKRNFFRVGNMRVPGSMSVNVSSGANMVLTTPLGLSLASDRRMGIGYYHTTPRLYYALGLYTYNMNELLRVRLYGVPEIAAASRLGYNFIHKTDEKLFGALNGYFYRPQDGFFTLDFAGGNETSFESHLFLRKLVPESHYSYNMGAEVAYQKNRFLGYVECLGTGVHTNRAKKDPLFFGWSATASYVILGQPRGYKTSSGDFSGSPYKSDSKGLEVGARVSGLSLKSGEIDGGNGIAYSAFASYWLSEHINFMAQVAYIDHNSQALGDRIYSFSGESFKGADFMALQFRTIINF